VTADSPHSVKLQRWMDGCLEGDEGNRGEKMSGCEREMEKVSSIFLSLHFYDGGREVEKGN